MLESMHLSSTRMPDLNKCPSLFKWISSFSLSSISNDLTVWPSVVWSSWTEQLLHPWTLLLSISSLTDKLWMIRWLMFPAFEVILFLLDNVMNPELTTFDPFYSRRSLVISPIPFQGWKNAHMSELLLFNEILRD